MTEMQLDAELESRVAELSASIRESAASGTKLAICGSGSKDFYGNAMIGMPLDVRGLNGPLRHEPSELVVTAAAGTSLLELEETLSSANQMLAFEPPHFGSQATVGGCVAAGLCGPRRIATGYAGGALRDHVLGAKLLDGRGNLLSFGGTVIKNVAGYDVARLLAGSLGILGVLVEVSLKVVPRPTAEITLAIECDEVAALKYFGDWNLQSWPISASSWNDGRLLLRLSGATTAVRMATRAIGGDLLDEQTAANFWRGVREQTDSWFALTPEETLWRVSLPAGAPTLDPRKRQSESIFLEWHGMQRWIKTRDRSHTSLREQAHGFGGYVTRFRCGVAPDPDSRQIPAFEALSPALQAIHQRLKAEFDPSGIFNYNRLQPNF